MKGTPIGVMRRALMLPVLVVAVAARVHAQAAPQTVNVSFPQLGHVTVVAQNATLGEILDEWSRVGDTKVFADRLPADRISAALSDVEEREALKSLFERLPGYSVSDRAEIVPGRSRFAAIRVLGRTTAAPDASQVVHAPPPEVLFEYSWPSDVRFPTLPEPPAPDLNAPPVAPLPEGVAPDVFYDYALPSGERPALPPGVDSIKQNAAPPADLPMPELRFQYASPTPLRKNGTAAPPGSWDVADPDAPPAETPAVQPASDKPASDGAKPEAAPATDGSVKTEIPPSTVAPAPPAPAETATKTGSTTGKGKSPKKPTAATTPKRPASKRKPGGYDER